MFGKSKLQSQIDELELRCKYLKNDVSHLTNVLGTLLDHFQLHVDHQPEKLILKPKDVSRKDS